MCRHCMHQRLKVRAPPCARRGEKRTCCGVPALRGHLSVFGFKSRWTFPVNGVTACGLGDGFLPLGTRSLKARACGRTAGSSSLPSAVGDAFVHLLRVIRLSPPSGDRAMPCEHACTRVTQPLQDVSLHLVVVVLSDFVARSVRNLRRVGRLRSLCPGSSAGSSWRTSLLRAGSRKSQSVRPKACSQLERSPGPPSTGPVPGAALSGPCGPCAWPARCPRCAATPRALGAPHP